MNTSECSKRFSFFISEQNQRVCFTFIKFQLNYGLRLTVTLQQQSIVPEIIFRLTTSLRKQTQFNIKPIVYPVTHNQMQR